MAGRGFTVYSCSRFPANLRKGLEGAGAGWGWRPIGENYFWSIQEKTNVSAFVSAIWYTSLQSALTALSICSPPVSVGAPVSSHRSIGLAGAGAAFTLNSKDLTLSACSGRFGSWWEIKKVLNCCLKNPGWKAHFRKAKITTHGAEMKYLGFQCRGAYGRDFPG